MALPDRLLSAERRLISDLAPQRFALPVTHVYNPLEYAQKPHREYVRRFGATTKRVVYFGMNPGPYGMVQTGVPFGEVALVRDWMGIEGKVGRPRDEHPKRPVTGFACTRSEVSGARLWGAIAEQYQTPARFFRSNYVANYCPLVFMEESGKNRTPDKLLPKEREPLYAACDRHLQRLVKILEPEWVIGIGKFAERRAALALEGMGLKIGTVLHPSPASPLANQGWAAKAQKQLRQLGICER